MTSEKQYWEERVPVVEFTGSCTESDCVGEINLFKKSTFVGHCRHFGKRPEKRQSHRDFWEDYGSHEIYLEAFRSTILESLVSTYPGARTTKDGVVQVLLFGHNHSFHDLGRIGRDLNLEKQYEYQKKVIDHDRTNLAIPVFPWTVEQGASTELFLHALEVLKIIRSKYNNVVKFELHAQLGSSNAVTVALLHALYHYRICIDPNTRISTYLVDEEYNGEKVDRRGPGKRHGIPIPFLD